MTIELSENVIDAIALAVKTGVVKKIQEPKIEQWEELKETITELRDNDGTGTQQEVCKFLANYMDVLEKQMEQPCEDAISRQAVKDMLDARGAKSVMTFEHFKELLDKLPLVTTQPKIGHWIDKKCSVCGCKSMLGLCIENYCPNCGAKMEVEE